MMRLINADKCLEDLKTAFKDQSTPEDPNTPNTWTAAMIAVIENQPTVLDLERVIAETLKQRDEYGRSMRKENAEFVKGGEALFQAKASHAWYSGVRAGLLRALDILLDAVPEKTDTLRYEVYEDNGGGLTMFVLQGEKPIWGHSGYEHAPESLQKDIRALQTTNSIEDWEGNGSYDGHNFYTWEELGITLEEYYHRHHVFGQHVFEQRGKIYGEVGTQLVADSGGIYTERMGCIAQEAFHVGEYAVKEVVIPPPMGRQSMDSFIYKGSRVVVRKQHTGNLPEEDQRTCFCCSKKINDCKTVLLVNNYRNIPNTLLHAECFDAWEFGPEDLCREIEEAYEEFQKLTKLLGPYLANPPTYLEFSYHTYLKGVLDTLEKSSPKASEAPKKQRSSGKHISEVSELLEKLDSEKMAGLTDFEYVQFFDALYELEKYRNIGTPAECEQWKANNPERTGRMNSTGGNNRTAPYIVQKARILQDKNRWCCVLGDVLTGIVGYGNTPEQACAEFDRIWRENENKYTLEQIVDAITQADAEIAAAIEMKDRGLLIDVLREYLGQYAEEDAMQPPKISL